MRHQDRVSSQQPFAVALAMGLCAAGLGSTILAADIEVTFAGSTNVFGGREVKMPVAIESKEAFRGVLQWRLSADRRTLAAGELLAEVDAGQSVVETLVRMPEVKDGVVLEAEFSVSIGQADEFDLKQPVWIYSADPFSGRTAWLRELNLALYDPEGNTAEIFKEAKIPLRTCRTFATMRELTEGTLIIGEGVSLARHRGLSELLLSQASHGLNVICLAPKDGRFEIPDIAPISEVGSHPIGPQSMSLRQTDALTELDKRFDVVRWGNKPAVIARLRHRAVRSQVVLEAASDLDSEDFRGWPWWEVRFQPVEERSGKLVVCGFGVIQHWEDSPTARFAFAELLRRELIPR